MALVSFADLMQGADKYARVERERRFLVDWFPLAEASRARRIVDRYIDGTRLRLRQQTESDGAPVFKLTQKLASRGAAAQQGLITTIYLSEGEFRLLERLPGKTLEKTRYSVAPFGIDVFEGSMRGLRLAEAEFDSAAEANALALPEFLLHEVTEDERFTGGSLVRASRDEVGNWLAEYGMRLRGI